MKSFEAKLYIEDNLATIEFDVTMKGKYDVDSEIRWNFGVIQAGLKDKPPLCILSVFDQDIMKMCGEILSPNNVRITFQNAPMAREISLKFLDLYIEGKWCLIFNHIYPKGVSPFDRKFLFDNKISIPKNISEEKRQKFSTSVELLDKKGRKTGYKAERIPTLKEVHKGNHTYAYVKHSADTEFDSKPMWEVPEKLAEDEIASLKNIRQNIEQNHLDKNDIIGEHSISRTMLHGLFDDEGKALDDPSVKRRWDKRKGD